MKPTLDEAERLIPRQDYRLDTLNCGGEDFALSCIRANLRYGKNSKREDIKSHHYIISFDPRDATDNGLTVDRAQALGLAYCKEHFSRTPSPCLHPPRRTQPQRQYPCAYCHQQSADCRSGAQALHGQGKRHQSRGQTPLHCSSHAVFPQRSHGDVPPGGTLPDRPLERQPKQSDRA